MYLVHLLFKKWGISPIVEKTTRWHHTANKDKEQKLMTQILINLIDLFLANQIIKDLNFG